MKIIKLLYITLILLFTVSNTGLPLVYHFCNGMKKADFETCKMCKMNSENSNLQNFAQKIVKNQNNCCESKVFVEKNDENFVLVKNEISNTTVILHFVNFDLNDEFKSKSENQFSILNSSPPTIKEIPLFLQNSIFLI